jgi:hypothetical protein
VFSILLFTACQTDLAELVEALQSDSPPEDTGNTNPAETVDDMGNELDGWPVGTDSDRIVLIIDGEVVEGTTITVEAEGEGESFALSAASLGFEHEGPLAISGACCNANGEDLSIELLAFRPQGATTAEYDPESGDIVLDHLGNLDEDGIDIIVERSVAFTVEDRSWDDEVWNQPVRIGSASVDDEYLPESIIGIVIEAGAAPEGYVVGGLEILDDMVLDTSLDDAGFARCRVTVEDGAEVTHRDTVACDEVRYPVWTVPAVGSSGLALLLAIEADGERIAYRYGVTAATASADDGEDARDAR